MMKLITSFLLFAMSLSTLASTQCLKDKNPCDPDLLCTFKAEWHSKVFLYVTMTMNDPSRKGVKKPADGYYYDGALYEASMAQARAENPGASLEKIKQEAGQIFQKKVEKFALTTFELPECELNGKLDTNRHTPPGYQGMSTDSDCKVWVKYYDSQYDPKEFGKNGPTCEEFYTRDFAHEQIHVKACQRMKNSRQPADHAFNIDLMIKEEASAYKHSMKLNEAYYKYLLAQCSDRYPNQESTRNQFKKINDLLKGYETRGVR